MSKFPAYERVSLKHPGFPRPIVIFGPVADLVRDRLLKDFPGKFASPQNVEENSTSGNGNGGKSSIVRLSSIREIMSQGNYFKPDHLNGEIYFFFTQEWYSTAVIMLLFC